MAVYKIFPEKDATMYSLFPAMNTGLDEMLEAGNLNLLTNTNPQVSRALIKFNQDDIITRCKFMDDDFTSPTNGLEYSVIKNSHDTPSKNFKSDYRSQHLFSPVQYLSYCVRINSWFFGWLSHASNVFKR